MMSGRLDMNEKKLEERKKMIYGLLCDELYVPMRTKEIAMLLDIPKSKRQDLQEVLDALVEEGKAQVSKKGKYQKAEKVVKEGAFISHAKGFGFVCVEDEGEDYYIPEEYVGNAFHGDQVRIELLPPSKGKRREAKIIEVLSHDISTVVGTYEKSKNYGFVISDNARITQDIFIPQGKDLHAVDGHKVVCQITSYGKKNRNPEGVITEILGHRNDPGVDIMSIVRGFDLPTEFPEKVLNQATRVANEVSEADRAGRLDLRGVTMVTIDGEDAKDLDDAISICHKGDGYELGVHIADVSNYVQERSALDEEAKKRGTSVYLVDRVIPMLPHTLSNGICSLNAGEDRLALSCIMTLDAKGNVIDHTIAETVVNIDARMSYTSVKKILVDKDPAECKKYQDLVPMFALMEELSGLIRKMRMQRGSIDFDFPETKIVLDAQGHAVDVMPYERNVATKIIEDFMLIANETVAEHFYWQEIPFLYRTHATPDGEKIRKLATFIGNFGYTIKGGADEVHPKELQKLLGKIQGTPEEDFISRLTLRSMQQAKYTVECTGHFGLAADYYCHFTSPIRRYPDLQIHRIIKETLRGRYNETRREHYESLLPVIATETSWLERRADEVEREVDKLKKVEYMSRHIGETFEGIVSSVTGWGLYVELPNTIEGLVHISTIRGDYYQFVEETYELVGERTNRHYKLGQRVKVVVDDCDTMARTIDFVLAEDEDE